MKINGKEIIGAGVIETALVGLTAKEYCLCVTYKKDRKNGKGFDIRRTTLPEIVRRNNDIALAIPEFVAENMCEGVALETCAKFCEKYNVEMLPIERKRLEDLRAIAAAKRAAANEAENGENGGDGTAAKKTPKPKKTTSERILAILERASDERDIQAAFILQVLEKVAPKSTPEIEKLLRYEFQKRTTPENKDENGGDKVTAATK